MGKISIVKVLGAPIIGMTVSACASHHHDEAMCKQVKPGVVTTVNSMCVIMNEDPVDPAIDDITWKGQKIGLCCEGCRPAWNKMTPSQKDAAVAKAIANSKTQ